MRITAAQLKKIIKEEVESLSQAPKKAPARKKVPAAGKDFRNYGSGILGDKASNDDMGYAEEFVSEFSMEHNSAAEMWMSDEEKLALWKAANSGAKFKVISWDRDDRRESNMAKTRQAKLLAAGYEVLAEDDGEIILVKE